MNGYIHHLIQPGLLLGAVGTLAIFSLVFRENKLYRLFEHIFLGLATGYGLAITWTQILRPKWWDPMVGGGHWIWILVVPLGLMFYGVYTKRFSWMARMIFGFYFGQAAGTIFQAFSSTYVPQIRASFKPLIAHAPQVTIWAAINNWIFVIILICVLTYFFFAFEQNSRVVKGAATAGRVMLMVAFGAIFGSTIMIREALLIDRVRFLLVDWLQLTHFVR